jgi:hypothetical protein
MSKCPNCPIAGSCVAERPGHEFACKFANGSDSERAWLVNQSARAQGVPPPAYPPLAQQAVSALMAAGRFVKSGMKTVDKAEYERRLAICKACDQYDAKTKRCKKCGCQTQVKLRMATERCPLPEPKW